MSLLARRVASSYVETRRSFAPQWRQCQRFSNASNSNGERSARLQSPPLVEENSSRRTNRRGGNRTKLTMDEFFANLENSQKSNAATNSTKGRSRNSQRQLKNQNDSARILSATSNSTTTTTKFNDNDSIQKVGTSSFFDEVNELVKKNKQAHLNKQRENPHSNTITNPNVKMGLSDVFVNTESAKGNTIKRQVGGMGNFFDEVNELVRKNKEIEAAKQKDIQPNHSALGDNNPESNPSPSIFDLLPPTKQRSENAYNEESFDEYIEMMEQIVNRPKFQRKHENTDDSDLSGVVEWLMKDEPSLKCNLPTLDQAIEGTLSQIDKENAKELLGKELAAQKEAFLEYSGWTNKQYDAAVAALNNVGHMCAKKAAGPPIEIAWEKLKELGVRLDKNSVQNFLYVSSTFCVNAIPAMAFKGGSVLDFLNQETGGEEKTTPLATNKDEAENKEVATATQVALFQDILLEPSEQSTSIRVRVLVSQGHAREAEELLDANATDDLRLRTYDPVFQCYLDQGEVAAALKLYVKMKGGDKVQMKAETYVQLMACIAENGYFQEGAPPIEGATELGYDVASGPRLFDRLASELAEDAIEISSASAKRLYNAIVRGFDGHGLRSLHLLESLPTCNDSAPATELVANRVLLDATNGKCPRTGVQLRLINLDGEQKEKLKSGLLSLSSTAYEQRSGKKNSKAEQELRNFGEWLETRPGKPFTAIVDGPNVAYYFQNFDQGTFNFHQIKFVVDALEEMGENVLVILPKKYTLPSFTLTKSTGQVRQHVTPKEREFLDNLISAGKAYIVPPSLLDDYYWMYASVSSQGDRWTSADQYIQPDNAEGRWAGIRPMLVSNDQMRDHKLSLLEPRLFRRWYSNFIVNFTFSAFVGDTCVDKEIGFSTADFYSREIQGNVTHSEDGVEMGTAWHFPISDWGQNESFCIRIPSKPVADPS